MQYSGDISCPQCCQPQTIMHNYPFGKKRCLHCKTKFIFALNPYTLVFNTQIITTDSATVSKRFYLLLLERNMCHYCKKYIELNNATIDHIIPSSKNGSNRIMNCVISCEKCNNNKSSIPYLDFVKYTDIMDV